MLIALYKPFRMLSQFSPDGSTNRTLRDIDLPKTVHPVGRLDADSEGLLILTDEPGWEHRLLHPSQKHEKSYFVQIEGDITAVSMEALRRGPIIQGKKCQPCSVRRLEAAPPLPDRDPPVRTRLTIPDCWLDMTLHEGKNRQVRRMTAAVGHPALRVVRHRIGAYSLPSAIPGQWFSLDASDRQLLTSVLRKEKP